MFRKGRLLLAGQDVLAVPGAPDGIVWVGIRPEGFTPDPNGPVVCGLSRVEVLGRDVSIVCTHPACVTDTLRAIVNAPPRCGRRRRYRPFCPAPRQGVPLRP